jgi:hypothetical protein
VEGEGEWALACSAYIHLNPVRIQALGLDKASRIQANMGAGLDPTLALDKERLRRLRSYAWSSYPSYAGRAKVPVWLTCGVLLSRIATEKPRAAYRRYVTERLGALDDEALSVSKALVLGSEAFKEWVRHLLLEANPENTGNAARWKRLLPFAAVMGCVEQLKGENWESFVNRHDDWGRELALYAGRFYCGATLPELGRAVGATPQAVGQSLARSKRKLASQPTFRDDYVRLLKLLQSRANS